MAAPEVRGAQCIIVNPGSFRFILTDVIGHSLPRGIEALASIRVI